mmetsp:Transcript_7082/g.17721  ORF Transcript_7082/g.17721 Transcript_7082/m.17721 type:complete len:223 (-) Transcript_7082:349-1017(-)
MNVRLPHVGEEEVVGDHAVGEGLQVEPPGAQTREAHGLANVWEKQVPRCLGGAEKQNEASCGARRVHAAGDNADDATPAPRHDVLHDHLVLLLGLPALLLKELSGRENLQRSFALGDSRCIKVALLSRIDAKALLPCLESGTIGGHEFQRNAAARRSVPHLQILRNLLLGPNLRLRRNKRVDGGEEEPRALRLENEVHPTNVVSCAGYTLGGDEAVDVLGYL